MLTRMSLDPIVAEITVPVTITEAFVGFTAQMGEWWDPAAQPRAAHVHRHRHRPRRAGRDRCTASEQYVWGRVMKWDPIGHYTQEFWLGHPEEEATVLDVRFTEAPEGTLVRLVHSGWTAGTEEVREKYTHWGDLLQRYATHVS